MEQTAFDIHVLPLQDKLFRYARSILQRRDEAEDATQDTLLKLWQRRSGLTGCRNIELFAMTMLRNTCYDRLRRRRVRGGDSTQPVVAVSDESGRWCDRELVMTAMSCLPESQREVLHLKDIEGYETHEIAVLATTEENQVRVTLSRARRRLREELIKLTDYGTKKRTD